MEAQQVSEAESSREQLQDLQDQVARQKASKQELETELDRMKQVRRGNSSQESLYPNPNPEC